VLILVEALQSFADGLLASSVPILPIWAKGFPEAAVARGGPRGEPKRWMSSRPFQMRLQKSKMQAQKGASEEGRTEGGAGRLSSSGLLQGEDK
jgi:hypothetical protein